MARPLRRSQQSGQVAQDELAQMPLGIWGRKAGLDDVLGQEDRVEIYRPLRIDPKSPCTASVGDKKWLGVPVLAKVAETFRAM